MTTPTGRRENKPNVQNIPIRTETGRKIREAFEKDLKLPDVDYVDFEERLSDLIKRTIGAIKRTIGAIK